MRTALVTGAGGFIGHHLAKYLKARSPDEKYYVVGVDLKWPEFERSAADQFTLCDLREPVETVKLLRRFPVDEVYHLAADMGGIGYITEKAAEIATNNTLIDVNILRAVTSVRPFPRLFYSSSACVYPVGLQRSDGAAALKESAAWPAEPEPGYGFEKLFMEQLCKYYHDDVGLETRVARFHNIFGPLGAWRGGKEKAPAAMCRKVARALAARPNLSGRFEIEIWGDGKQVRSFLYVDDCVEGIYRLMQSNYRLPLNIGSDREITIEGLVNLVATIAGHASVFIRNVPGAVGVYSRNCDSTLMREVLGWAPVVTLEAGLKETYHWIAGQLAAQKAAGL